MKNLTFIEQQNALTQILINQTGCKPETASEKIQKLVKELGIQIQQRHFQTELAKQGHGPEVFYINRDKLLNEIKWSYVNKNVDRRKSRFKPISTPLTLKILEEVTNAGLKNRGYPTGEMFYKVWPYIDKLKPGFVKVTILNYQDILNQLESKDPMDPMDEIAPWDIPDQCTPMDEIAPWDIPDQCTPRPEIHQKTPLQTNSEPVILNINVTINWSSN